MVRARRDPEDLPFLAMGGSDGPVIARTQRFRMGTGTDDQI